MDRVVFNTNNKKIKRTIRKRIMYEEDWKTWRIVKPLLDLVTIVAAAFPILLILSNSFNNIANTVCLIALVLSIILKPILKDKLAYNAYINVGWGMLYLEDNVLYHNYSTTYVTHANVLQPGYSASIECDISKIKRALYNKKTGRIQLETEADNTLNEVIIIYDCYEPSLFKELQNLGVKFE